MTQGECYEYLGLFLCITFSSLVFYSPFPQPSWASLASLNFNLCLLYWDRWQLYLNYRSLLFSPKPACKKKAKGFCFQHTSVLSVFQWLKRVVSYIFPVFNLFTVEELFLCYCSIVNRQGLNFFLKIFWYVFLLCKNSVYSKMSVLADLLHIETIILSYQKKIISKTVRNLKVRSWI